MAKSKGRVKEQSIRIKLPTPLEDFDKFVTLVNQDRGATDDHPKRNFRRIALLCAVVDECEDPEAKIALRAICTKIARLIHSPRHTDSWIDIAGYARTGVMLYSE